ncbi:hypothetical protein AJ80_07518 [Polytolypa hystricis UAMH7299]|uniref:Uncharacterized protein n=1 Tax=Polytolypa hystricis (strain UAMH7299) TaxID=1447883 RepID=A0A2B7XNG9_POLH7|nr:hypothetical protein AJ80_07518 [Polytolypa hystricis UAMH7299]
MIRSLGHGTGTELLYQGHKTDAHSIIFKRVVSTKYTLRRSARRKSQRQPTTPTASKRRGSVKKVAGSRVTSTAVAELLPEDVETPQEAMDVANGHDEFLEQKLHRDRPDTQRVAQLLGHAELGYGLGDNLKPYIPKFYGGFVGKLEGGELFGIIVMEMLDKTFSSYESMSMKET